MTDEWERLGLWDAYRADLEERRRENPLMVRPSPLGFEHFYDSFVGRAACDQIRSFPSNRPWFCWVGFGGPHDPWDAPEPYFSLYRPQDVPEPLPPVESAEPARPPGGLDGRVEGSTGMLASLGPHEIAALRANYAGKVTLIDHYVGEILNLLEERGDLERTLIVFASDHGEMNADHGLIGKSVFLEHAVTVPLVIRLPPPSHTAGGVIDSVVELIDIGPTLAEASGAALDYPHWGRSLWPLLRGEVEAVRDFAISESWGEIMATDAKRKVALNRDGAAYVVFDLEQDAAEVTNLAGSAAARESERQFRDLLLSFLVRTQVVL
jgi:choline-sulfatase